MAEMHLDRPVDEQLLEENMTLTIEPRGRLNPP